MPESPHPDEQLIDKAFNALIQFTQRYTEGPVTDRERAMVRFTLAFLYRGGDRAPYDAFYKAACSDAYGTDNRSVGRFQAMRAELAIILRQHGRECW